MKKLKMFALAAVALIGITGVANAATTMLAQDDFVGISFWIISMGMLAATAFFFMERGTVAPGWKTSVTVAGLVTGIAFIHYMYMREVWVATQNTPTEYRYIDWLITVPLLIVEFYIILRAVTDTPPRVFVKLLVGSLVMLIFGYFGVSGLVFGEPLLPFIIGMIGWGYIIYEIYAGETSSLSNAVTSDSVKSAYKMMRNIVVFGWAIYPIGYYLAYLTGSNGDYNFATLNGIYNLADFLNKIFFGLVIWSLAKKESNS